MAVKNVEGLSNDIVCLFDVYDLVAAAVNVIGALLEEAVFVSTAAVEIGDFLSCVSAVSFGIVVTVTECPVHTELFHEIGKYFCR